MNISPINAVTVNNTARKINNTQKVSNNTKAINQNQINFQGSKALAKFAAGLATALAVVVGAVPVAASAKSANPASASSVVETQKTETKSVKKQIKDSLPKKNQVKKSDSNYVKYQKYTNNLNILSKKAEKYRNRALDNAQNAVAYAQEARKNIVDDKEYSTELKQVNPAIDKSKTLRKKAVAAAKLEKEYENLANNAYLSYLDEGKDYPSLRPTLVPPQLIYDIPQMDTIGMISGYEETVKNELKEIIPSKERISCSDDEATVKAKKAKNDKIVKAYIKELKAKIQEEKAMEVINLAKLYSTDDTGIITSISSNRCMAEEYGNIIAYLQDKVLNADGYEAYTLTYLDGIDLPIPSPYAQDAQIGLPQAPIYQ